MAEGIEFVLFCLISALLSLPHFGLETRISKLFLYAKLAWRLYEVLNFLFFLCAFERSSVKFRTLWSQLSFATRVEDWTCLGQHKGHPELPVVTRESRRNSRKPSMTRLIMLFNSSSQWLLCPLHAHRPITLRGFCSAGRRLGGLFVSGFCAS